ARSNRQAGLAGRRGGLQLDRRGRSRRAPIGAFRRFPVTILDTAGDSPAPRPAARMDLIADIGATNTRCALLDDQGRIVALEVFKNEHFTGLEGLLAAYLEHRRSSDRPTRAALAVAAPIVGDEVRMTNIPWRFSRERLAERLGLSRLLVVNDFAAVAWSLPDLGPSDRVQIGRGEPLPHATLAT